VYSLISLRLPQVLHVFSDILFIAIVFIEICVIAVFYRVLLLYFKPLSNLELFPTKTLVSDVHMYVMSVYTTDSYQPSLPNQPYENHQAYNLPCAPRGPRNSEEVDHNVVPEILTDEADDNQRNHKRQNHRNELHIGIAPLLGGLESREALNSRLCRRVNNAACHSTFGMWEKDAKGQATT